MKDTTLREHAQKDQFSLFRHFFLCLAIIIFFVLLKIFSFFVCSHKTKFDDANLSRQTDCAICQTSGFLFRRWKGKKFDNNSSRVQRLRKWTQLILASLALSLFFTGNDCKTSFCKMKWKKVFSKQFLFFNFSGSPIPSSPASTRLTSSSSTPEATARRSSAEPSPSKHSQQLANQQQHQQQQEHLPAGPVDVPTPTRTEMPVTLTSRSGVTIASKLLFRLRRFAMPTSVINFL